jgi:hypothetical protein
MIKEPDLADVFRYTNEVRNNYQLHFAQIQERINEAGIGVLM